MRSLRPLRRGRNSALKLFIRTTVAGYAAFAGLNAQAAEPGVAAAFGNTVISTYPDGRSQKIWLHPDGSWTGLSRSNKQLAGKWVVRGEKVCLRQSTPPTLPISYCTALPTNSQPGAQWTGKDAGGQAITLSLVKGVPAQYQGQVSSKR